ncbi:MAG: phosphate ABC transporter permease subunit PstC [Clostridiales bacterium]|nr:phosphate ABC transporter permease subunit PstC [Clostridiales bacterium]
MAGLISVVCFFLPYITFVFKNTVYTVSAFQLATVKGFVVRGPELTGLVAVPLLTRIAVIAGVVLAVAGVLLIVFNKPVAAGTAFVISGMTPLIVLMSASAIQEAVTQLNISEISVDYLWPYIYILLGGIFCSVLSLWVRGTEKLAESMFLVFSCVSVGSVLIITIYIFAAGAPAILQIGLGNFLFGATWNADAQQFGILPLILSSIAGTVGAIVIGVPIGILTSVFLAETARPRLAKLVHPAVELLAGIPSVVYGFFGMLVIVPAIRDFPPFRDHTIGDSLLAAVIILAIMVLPTIVNVSETSLRAVPQSYREASLALGATPTITIFKVVIPAARSGILAGVILGVGRAIGETMAVIMVAGNVANMPSLLGTVRFLTTGIAMEMSYASGLHRQALFAIGLVLFVFIMIVNVSFTYISKRGVQMDAE